MNNAELKAFWQFIERRQRIWWRKEVLKKPPPWTKDVILRDNWFTNVYRELDPGTQFVTEHIEDQGLSAADTAFWILFYRYCGSNREAMREVALVPVSRYSPTKAESALNKHPTPFGQAYTVFPMTNERTGKSKVQQVTEGFADIADRWPGQWNRMIQQDKPQDVYALIQGVGMGIGPFTAYQSWVDYSMLTYIPHGRNDWVMPGPGAIRGASIIWDEPLSVKKAQDAVRWLFDSMLETIRFTWDHPMWLDHPPYLSDIQNCLCEYQKYVRVRDGGRPTRFYRRGS